MKHRRKLIIFFAISFIVVGFLIFQILKPLLNTILLGFVFAFLFYPLYKQVKKIIKVKRVSALIICLLFILILTIPMIFAIHSLAVEVFLMSDKFSEVSFNSFIDIECTSGFFCKVTNRVLENRVLERTVADVIGAASDRAKGYIGIILISIPAFVLQAFIIIFMMYYLFIDGEDFIRKLKESIPISERHKEIFFSKTKTVLGGILFGSIVVGAIQGLFGTIGFMLFGIKAPILWGIMMFLFSFMPLIGTGVIWFPTSMYIIINSIINNDESGIFRGIGLLIYCAIFVSTVDNFIRPKMVSDRTRIHPVLVLFGVIGGIIVFKAAGVIIGPLVLGIFLTLLDMFEKEKYYLFSQEDNDNEDNVKKIKKRKVGRNKISRKHR